MPTQAEIDQRLQETYDRYEEAERSGDTEQMEQIRAYGEQLRSIQPDDIAPDVAPAEPGPALAGDAPPTPPPAEAAPADGALGWMKENIAKPFYAGVQQFTAGLSETAADIVDQAQNPELDYLEPHQREAYMKAVADHRRQGLRSAEIPKDRILKRIMTPTQKAQMWRDRMESDAALPFRGTAAEIRARAKENMPEGIENEDLLSSPEVFTARASETIGRMAPAVALRRPVVGSTAIAADVYGASLNEGREMGLNDEQNRQRASVMAAVELLTEKVPLDYILKRSGGGGLTQVGKNMLKAAGAEGIQESLVEAINMGYDTGILDEDIDAREALIRIRDAFILGGTAGAALRAPMEVVDAARGGTDPDGGANVDKTFTGNAATMKSVLDDIEAVQSGEYIEDERQDRLVDLGYAKRRGDNDLVVLPAGRRARGELADRVSKAKEEAWDGPDRRKDRKRREQVNKMSDEERYNEIMVDQQTGLLSKRAFEADWEENPDRPAMAAFIDADGLGYVNDNMGGHDVGDQYLQMIGAALESSGLDSYHISGDEFVITGETEAELQQAMDAVNAELADQVIQSADGSMAMTPSVSFGIAEDKTRADELMLEQKKQRRAEGTLAPKGQTPIGLKMLKGEPAPTLATKFAQPEEELAGPPPEPPSVSPEQETELLARKEALGAMAEPSQKINNATDELMVAIGKLGGVSREAAEAEGFDPEEFKRNPAFPTQAKYQDMDSLREALEEEGYVGADTNELLDKMADSLRGTPQYSVAVDTAQMGPAWATVLADRAEKGGRKITPRAATKAIDKFLAGEKLGAREERFIEDLMADIDEQQLMQMAEEDPLAAYEMSASEVQSFAHEYYQELEQGIPLQETESRIDQEETDARQKAEQPEAEPGTEPEPRAPEQKEGPDTGRRPAEERPSAAEPNPRVDLLEEGSPEALALRDELIELSERLYGPVQGRVTKKGNVPPMEGMTSAGGLMREAKRKKGQRITNENMTFVYPGGTEVTVPVIDRDEDATKAMADRVYSQELLRYPTWLRSAHRGRWAMEGDLRRRDEEVGEEGPEYQPRKRGRKRALTPEQAAEVRWFYRTTSNSMDRLAKRFGVSQGAIQAAIDRTGVYADDPPDVEEEGGRYQVNTAWTPNSRRISTRVPWNVRSEEDAIGRDLVVGIEAARLDPRAMDRNANHLRTTYGNIRIPKGANTEEVFESVISHLSGNLTWLYGQIPANWRGRAQRWYEGANRLSGRLAGRFGYDQQTGAAVIAALSPQKDWRENISLAERVMDIWTNQQATKPTPAMRRLSDDLYGDSHADNLRVVLRSQLRQLQTPIQQAMWVRLYDQAHNPQTYREVTPEGNFGDIVTTTIETIAGDRAGPPSTLRWNSLQTVAKALKVLQDPSNDNISAALGAGHKVRNFYNNIVTPDSVRGDVTIDTHAVAAAQLMPVGASHPIVDQNFGSSRGVSDSGDTGLQGLYWVYAEAYRRAAGELGIMPRQLQSAVWEGARGLFPEGFKNERNMAAAEAVWNNYQSEVIEADAAREQISEQANGIADPAWVGSSTRPYAGSPNSTYDPEVREPGVAEEGSEEGAPPGRREGEPTDRGEASPELDELVRLGNELADNESLRYDLENFQDVMRAKYAGSVDVLEMSISSQGDLSLDMLIVGAPLRKLGTGSAVMNDIVEYADENGLRVTLQPADKNDAIGTTSRARLVRFYKRFGFVENKGRNKDYALGGPTQGTVMYRNAQAQEEFTLEEIGTSKDLGVAFIERMIENVETDTLQTTVPSVDSAEDAVAILQPIASRAQENMLALVLDENWQPLQVIKHTIGLHDRASVHPHMLIGSILDVPKAKHVYFAHNHPSDVESPSQSDMNITRVLAEMMYDTQNFDGTGISPVGMLVLTPSGKKATIIRDGRADELDPEYARRVQEREGRVPLETPRQVPVTERTITVLPDHQLEKISGSAGTKAWIRKHSPDTSGVLYLDTRHNIVGYLPLTADQMLAPGADAGVGSAILRTLHQTNAAAVIVHDVSETSLGGRMVAGFLNRHGGSQTDVLDVIHGERKVSLKEQGTDISAITAGPQGRKGPGRVRDEIREDEEYDTPYLTSAAKKIGPEKASTTFWERWTDYYTSFKREWQAGFFDKFHGIGKALDEAGEPDDGYIEARFSTGLDAVMRSIMEYGSPRWGTGENAGMVMTGGKGLGDILAPIGDAVKEWSMFMAGRRAKRLLMEGYTKLAEQNERGRIDNWLSANGYEVNSEGAFNAMADAYGPDGSTVDGQGMPAEMIEQITAAGRERNFHPAEIRDMVALVEDNPVFQEVADEYAEFNRQVLDFAEAAGVINPDTRPLWEHADYVPFYRIRDDRMVGPIKGGRGIEGQQDPTRYLKGEESPIGNIVDNILANVTNLVDSSMKNQAARTTVDALKGSGIINKVPLSVSTALIPMGQVKKILVNAGIDPQTVPSDALNGLRMMTSMEPPTSQKRRADSNGGAISIMRDGKREYYHTEDQLLYRAMTAINMEQFGRLTQAFRNFKRFFTGTITLDPGFMMRNYSRDLLSSYVLDRSQPPGVRGALKATAGLPMHMARSVQGFKQAIMQDESYRTMMSAGAAFDSGYINYGDPAAAGRAIRKSMRSKGFRDSVLDSPIKLFEAYKALGSAVENANRIAVYNAAIKAGKSKKQAAYEAKDLMDFSMGGDYPVVQWLIQTVPFMGARLQGLHRLGRGAYENPKAFTYKGLLLMSAGMALWFAYRDDERYKSLEDWDKDAYYHFWVGDRHFRLPKPFEIGALFNTIPERFAELALSDEPDAGKLYLKRMWHMIGETFAMNPIPQPLMPIAEDIANFNFFTQRELVSAFEEKRLPADQYRHYTSPTFREMSEAAPRWMQKAFPRLTSPLVMENYYRGWTGTMGQYALLGADAMMREAADYPGPPSWALEDYPVISSFYRGIEPEGEDIARRTRYSDEFYTALRETMAVKESMQFLDREKRRERAQFLKAEYGDEIRLSKRLESIREKVSDINRKMRRIYQRPTEPGADLYMSPEDKYRELKELERRKQREFKRGYEMRSATIPEEEEGDLAFLLEEFGVDDSTEALAEKLEDGAPITASIVREIMALPPDQREALAQRQQQPSGGG